MIGQSIGAIGSGIKHSYFTLVLNSEILYLIDVMKQFIKDTIKEAKSTWHELGTLFITLIGILVAYRLFIIVLEWSTK